VFYYITNTMLHTARVFLPSAVRILTDVTRPVAVQQRLQTSLAPASQHMYATDFGAIQIISD
jgi:hypothetical protein